MSCEEFWKFQNDTGLTTEKIKTMTSQKLKEEINKYRNNEKNKL